MFEELSVLLEVIKLIHDRGEGRDGDALECVEKESQHHLIPRLLLKLFEASVGSLQCSLVFPENASDAPERLEAAVIIFKTVVCVSLSLRTNMVPVLLFLLLHRFLEPD